MHIVVNHLHLRDPVTETAIASAQEAVRLVVVDAGGLAAHVAQVDDRHLILILE